MRWWSRWLATVRGRCYTLLLYAEALMVFKSIGEALPGSVASWAFSGCARSGTQDHPVYIPRASRRPGRLLAAEHLFRRSMEGVRSVRRNPYRQVSILPGVWRRRHSPVPSGQSVRKL